MDSVGLGQSFKEECENCERLRREVDALEYRVLGLKDGLEERDKLKAQIEVLKKKLFSLSSLNVKYPAEIDALERRVDELEDEKQDILDNPEQHFDWGDLD